MINIRTDKSSTLPRAQRADWEIQAMKANSGDDSGMVSREEKEARQQRLDEALRAGYAERMKRMTPEEAQEQALQIRIARMTEQNSAETEREKARKEIIEGEARVEKLIKKINASSGLETEDEFYSKWNQGI